MTAIVYLFILGGAWLGGVWRCVWLGCSCLARGVFFYFFTSWYRFSSWFLVVGVIIPGGGLGCLLQRCSFLCTGRGFLFGGCFSF